jgi:hypothetical protein
MTEIITQLHEMESSIGLPNGTLLIAMFIGFMAIMIAVAKSLVYITCNASPSETPVETDVTVEDVNTVSTSHNVSGGGLTYTNGKLGTYSGSPSTVSEDKYYVYLRHNDGKLTQNTVDADTYAALSRLTRSQIHVFAFESGYRWNGNWLDTINILENGTPNDSEAACE